MKIKQACLQNEVPKQHILIGGTFHPLFCFPLSSEYDFFIFQCATQINKTVIHSTFIVYLLIM
jgi:hypothetical protein